MRADVTGVWDLWLSRGVPMEPNHPKVKDAIGTVVKAAQRAGKPVGTHEYDGDRFGPDADKRLVDGGSPSCWSVGTSVC